MCKWVISPAFLHFFHILIFGVNNGIKGQKIDQNDKKNTCDFDFWYTSVK